MCVHTYTITYVLHVPTRSTHEALCVCGGEGGQGGCVGGVCSRVRVYAFVSVVCVYVLMHVVCV